MATQSTVLETSSFEAAFSVKDEERSTVMRRFSTLILDTGSSRKQGSNGYVCRAVNVFGETYAVKMMRTNPTATPIPGFPVDKEAEGAIMAFREEYEIQKMLAPMNGFPKVFGYGTTKGNPVIVMEWIEGMTLKDMAESLDSDNRVPMGMAVASALFGILKQLDVFRIRPVHRDLSPSNVMISLSEHSFKEQLASGRFDLRIIDFGSTALVDNTNPSFTAHTSILRRATPEYAPPEMLSDTLPNILELRKSPSIDVYAASSIIYELLTGRTTHMVSKNREVLPYHAKCTLPPRPSVKYFTHYLGKDKEKAITKFIDLLMKAFSQDQAERPSAKALSDAIDAVLAGSSLDRRPDSRNAESGTQGQSGRNGLQ